MIQAKATIDSITGVLTGVKANVFAPVIVIATNSDGMKGTAAIFVIEPQGNCGSRN